MNLSQEKQKEQERRGALLLEREVHLPFGGYHVYTVREGVSRADPVRCKDNGQLASSYTVVPALIREAIDLDSWKHSWHLDYHKYYDEEVQAKILKIMDEKIQQRIEELALLQGVRRIIEKVKSPA